MKSRTSFFNSTAFKKNLTRFAPVWGLYTVCLFMGLFLMSNSGVSHWLFRNLADCIQAMAVINLGYGLICALVLFGDLYNSRMCNMLHALPIRREGWFVTHLVSGLAFSMVPTGLMTLAALALTPFSDVVNAWQIPLLWWLGTNLEFLFFFGVATLAALCVGSRFAQAVVYGIVNFASTLAYFLIDTIYTPLIYGIRTNEQPFLWLCPVYKMADNSYVDMWQTEVPAGFDPYGYQRYDYYGEFVIENTWWYLFLCAAIGIAFMVLALRLYQKRRLETAGDFIAIKALEPVFLVVYTLVIGTCFDFLFTQMMGSSEGFLFLFVGLAVGWFTGKMFLERQVNVFHKRAFLGYGVLVAVFLASIGLTNLDPLGIETWVPKANDVASVHVGTGHGTWHESQITPTEQADIEEIIAIHKDCLETRIDETGWETVEVISEAGFYETVMEEVVYKERLGITITYTLKNGTQKGRYYYIYAEDAPGQVLDRYFSTPEAVFGIPREEITEQWLYEFADALDSYGGSLMAATEFIRDLTREEKVDLLRALVADCENGTMTQQYSFRRGDHELFWLGWQGPRNYEEIRVDTDDIHVVQWLEERGFDIEEAFLKEYGEEYVKEYFG